MSVSRSGLSRIAPGILVAATGVGAGDLLTASLAGATVGLALLWAAVAGAVLKWVINEGIARWQMATEQTLLEGWESRLGAWIQWVFLIYLLFWTYVVGGALISACGVAGSGVWQFTDNLQHSKIIWGVVHSFAGLVLVLAGGYKLFEKLMSVCIGVMFVAVVLTAVLLKPDWAAMGRAILLPVIPEGGLNWALAVIGGVGGTVTILSYGYWIREVGRAGAGGLRACRLDLSLGYGMTALFGMSMIVIGSRVELESGVTAALELAAQLEQALGTAGRWIFLLGFWGAVFSSLLGVWQSVPYMFADFLAIRKKRPVAPGALNLASTPAYRIYLVLMSVLPLPMLWMTVKEVQLIYAVLGALFMPVLALTLLIMNNRRDWIGAAFKNGWLTNAVLVLTLLFFAYAGLRRLGLEFRGS